jgi:hypothetical protein
LCCTDIFGRKNLYSKNGGAGESAGGFYEIATVQIRIAANIAFVVFRSHVYLAVC